MRANAAVQSKTHGVRRGCPARGKCYAACRFHHMRGAMASLSWTRTMAAMLRPVLMMQRAGRRSEHLAASTGPRAAEVPDGESEREDAEGAGQKRMRAGAESPGLKEGEGRGEEHDESANRADGSSFPFQTNGSGAAE